jgi:guanosine-3',5'-bis(diphosphate) 3'-pyrophosphohydrolase
MKQPFYPLLQKAIIVATKAHKDQDRSETHALPYIVHPIEVLIHLKTIAKIKDERVLCAAVLHDVLERTKIKLKDLQSAFDSGTCNLVIELTREEPSKALASTLTKKQLRQLRSQMLLDEIAKMSAQAQMIKLADRLANLQLALQDKPNKKLKTYLDQTQMILNIISPTVCLELWEALNAQVQSSYRLLESAI